MPETTPEPANCPYCPYCPHPAHRPGVECESIVEHSPERWHRCLCLNLVAADAPCPPQMDCQGGTLGYSEAWHLVRGRGPHATPEPADRAALRDQIAAALYERATPGCRWADLHPDDRVALWDDADAVLAVLPAPADRAGECPECDNTGACNGGPCPLRRLADESQQPTSVPATCPAPTSRQSEWCAAADALDAGTARFIAEWPDERQSPYMQGRRDAAAYLRTLADEAGQSEAEAHRTLTEWIAEVLEVDGMWMYLGTGPDRSVAERRRASVTRRHPGAETRTVRKTTTYTVADDAQQPVPADRGTAATTDETAATIQAEEVCGEPDARPGTTDHTLLHRNRPEHHVEAEGAQRPEVRAVPTVAYSGKGRAFCLTCPRPAGEDVPLTVNDIEPYECCAACGRDLRDVAEGAQR